MNTDQLPKELDKILNISLSFAGCGFLGIYHVGVGTCFKKYASHLLLRNVVGASAGALVATLLLLDLPIDFVASEFFNIVGAARNHSLGAFSPAFDIQEVVTSRLHSHLPEDAHKKLSGRLHISLTRIYDGKNIVVSQFNSREDLIDALACSFFIPGFSGYLPPKFHGVRYMDGAFSNNLVALDDGTVTVSPFYGETDICPRDDTDFKYHISLCNTSMELSTRNANRLLHSLIPPSPKELSDLLQQGYNDALEFLHRNNLIACNSCTEMHLNFIISKEPPKEYDPECGKCSKSREESMHESMPEQVLTILSNHMEGPNSALIKFFNAMAIPVLIPCSLANFFLKKVSSATNSVFEIKRLVIEKMHQVFIKALNELHCNCLDEEEALSRQSSNDDGFSEEKDGECPKRKKN